jgi:hypothetical protein
MRRTECNHLHTWKKITSKKPCPSKSVPNGESAGIASTSRQELVAIYNRGDTVILTLRSWLDPNDASAAGNLHALGPPVRNWQCQKEFDI